MRGVPIAERMHRDIIKQKFVQKNVTNVLAWGIGAGKIRNNAYRYVDDGEGVAR